MLISLSCAAMAEESYSSDQLPFFLVLQARVTLDCRSRGWEASSALACMSLAIPSIAKWLEGWSVAMLSSTGKLVVDIVLAMNLPDERRGGMPEV
jgi:hypothetical protein